MPATAKKSDALVLHIGNDKVPMATTPDESLLTAAQLKLLASPTPDKWVKKRQGRGGKSFDYVEINYVVGLLNAIFGFDWSVEVLDKIIDTKSDSIVMLVRLKVSFANGKMITKDAFGGADIKRAKNSSDIIDLADDLKAAESDAIKKAASMLGVAWDVYSGFTKSNGGNNGNETIDEDFGTPPDEKDPLDDAITAETASVDKKDAFRNVPLVLSDGKKHMVTKFDAYKKFGKLKEAIGQDLYYQVLGLSGHKHANEIPDKLLPAVYAMLIEKLRQQEAAVPNE